MTVEERRAELNARIAEPVITADMTKAQCRAEMDRWHADSQLVHDRLDEESLVLGLGWSPSVCATHELMWEWWNATADRWYRALPERYMTPDSLAYPDWDHSHYEHDEHGHTGRVTTKQRTPTAEELERVEQVKAILARLDSEEDT
jgi:hypothetical protein